MTETPHLIQRRSELGSECSIHELSNANELGSQNWDVILPRSVLRPGVPSTRHHHFELAESSKIYTHIRVNMFPDGGIARLGVYGTVSAPNTKDIIDCACVLNGGVAIEFTDAHYGTPQNMLLPIPATG